MGKTHKMTVALFTTIAVLTNGFSLVGAGLTSLTTDNVALCNGKPAVIPWSYDDETHISTVTWSKDGAQVMYYVGGSLTVLNNSYELDTATSNAGLKVKTVESTSVGTYTCSVAYQAGFSASDQGILDLSGEYITTPPATPTGSCTEQGSSTYNCTCSITDLGNPAATLQIKVNGGTAQTPANAEVTFGETVECCVEGKSAKCLTPSSPSSLYCVEVTVPEKENGGPNGGAIGGGVGGGVCGIVVITIVIIIIRRRMQAVDVEIMDPKGGKVKPTITSHKDGVYLVEFTPTLAGCYTIKISISGKAIPDSPLSVIIGAAHASKAWYTSGLGIQQSGVRVNTKAKFKVHTKGDGDKVGFEVISPAGQNIKCEIKRSEKEVGVFECHYIPPVVGRYVIKIIDEQNITESTFEVDVRPEKTSKLGAYGLEEGVVNQLASFIVESGVIDDKDQTKSKKTEEQAGNDGCFPRNNSILPICAGTDQQPQPSQGGQGQGGQHTAKGQTKLPPDHGRQKPDGDNGRPLPIPDKDDGLQKSKTEKSGSVVSKGDVEIDEAPQFPRKLPEIPPGGEKNIRGISANFDEVVPDKKRLTPIGKETIEKCDEESPRKKKKKKKDKGKDTSVEYNTDL